MNMLMRLRGSMVTEARWLDDHRELDDLSGLVVLSAYRAKVTIETYDV